MPKVGISRKGEVSLPRLLEDMRSGLPDEVGAIGCFIGIVRGISSDGEAVESLRYECSEETAEKLGEIASEMEKRPGVSRVVIHHIIDELKPGEDAIYVLVAGKHRADVFQALSGIMDRIKAEAPIWKKEVTETSEYWVSG